MSSLLARQTGVWHVKKGTNVSAEQLRIPVEDLAIDKKRGTLKAVLAGYDAEFSLVRELLEPLSFLDLYYEGDIAPDPQVAYVKAVEHIGCAMQPATAGLGRTTPYPLREVIQNFDEVAAHLAGTRFEWMLEG